MLFISAPYLCTVVKIYVIVSVLLIAASAYIALEVLLKLEKDHTPEAAAAAADELVVTVGNTTATAAANDET